MKLLEPTHVDQTAIQVDHSLGRRGHSERRPMKISIGKPVPRLRLTAVVNGDYTHLDPAVVTNRWLVLCFPSSLRAVDLLCLNHQASYFARTGALLLGVVSDQMLLQPFHHRQLQNLAVPLLTDPLNRLHRAYGIACSPASGKANTFLIDPHRVLRHHMIHDLTTWNMEALCGLLALEAQQDSQADSILSERSRECHR
jgi:alkyl hydroperoxide reductase subunit AhpC